MKTRLRVAWQSRAPRERMVLLLLGAVISAVLYGWFMDAAGRERSRLRDSVTTLRLQAAGLEEQAVEYARLRAAPAATASSIELRALVQARIGAAGLTSAVLRMDSPADNRVIVTFGSLPFADWMAWIASLQGQQVRLEACRIEALSTPGLVSVSATLARGGL